MSFTKSMITKQQKIIKRIFDFVFSLLGLLLLGWLIVFLILIAGFDTQAFGLFIQKRIGLNGKLFHIFKIRTYKNKGQQLTTSTFGDFLRNSKLDELPQLVNVLLGNMSFVGPRPDIVGFADMLTGENRLILSVKPGITGPASIYFKNEEKLLQKEVNPEEYNKAFIWPKKVEINLNYVKNYSLKKDLLCIFNTLFS